MIQDNCWWEHSSYAGQANFLLSGNAECKEVAQDMGRPTSDTEIVWAAVQYLGHVIKWFVILIYILKGQFGWGDFWFEAFRKWFSEVGLAGKRSHHFFLCVIPTDCFGTTPIQGGTEFSVNTFFHLFEDITDKHAKAMNKIPWTLRIPRWQKEHRPGSQP